MGLMRGSDRKATTISGCVTYGLGLRITSGTVRSNRVWRGVLLHCFVSFIYEASDERDKIFALLVLMNQISISYGLERMPLVADYTRDAAGLCKDVTAWLITATGWVSDYANNQHRVWESIVPSRLKLLTITFPKAWSTELGQPEAIDIITAPSGHAIVGGQFQWNQCYYRHCDTARPATSSSEQGETLSRPRNSPSGDEHGA